MADGAQIFLSAVSDAHWQTLCSMCDWTDWAADARLQTNNERMRQRPSLLPKMRERLKIPM